MLGQVVMVRQRVTYFDPVPGIVLETQTRMKTVPLRRSKIPELYLRVQYLVDPEVCTCIGSNVNRRHTNIYFVLLSFFFLFCFRRAAGLWSGPRVAVAAPRLPSKCQ